MHNTLFFAPTHNAAMAVDNCAVYIECTTGMGDVLADAISGVTVALERGCVRPTVHTRWQRRSRHYPWPSLVSSELFTMAEAVAVGPDELRHGAPLAPLKYGGGPWPRQYHVDFDSPSTVVVTYPRPPFLNGSCGNHDIEHWVAPLVSGVAHERLVERFRQVAHSVRLVNTTMPLPADIGERTVVHARRGDMLDPHHLTAWGGKELLDRVYEAVVSYLQAKGSLAYLATDDPVWGRSYAAHLRAAGIDTAFNEQAAASDDLRAMMHARQVVLAGLQSKFSTLASLLAGVPLVHFASKAATREERAKAHARNGAWVSDGLLNLTVLEVDAYRTEGARMTLAHQQPERPPRHVPSSEPPSEAGSASDGFRGIEVYIGTAQAHAARVGTQERIANRRDVRVDRTGTWHAQSGQDRTIARLHEHRRGGFFVDLASNEPLHLSNTRTLERDFGWTGVCIDASAELLLKSTLYRTCRCVQAVVTESSGDTITFTTPITTATSSNVADMKKSGFGSIVGIGQVSNAKSAEPAAESATSKTALPSKVPAGWKEERHVTVSLGELLRHVSAPAVIEYLSLDVEGAEAAVLGSGFDFGSFTFLTITIERPSAALRERLRAHSYLFVGEHGCYGDQLWVHQSFAAQAQRVLGLPSALSSARDSGENLWFANCSVKGQPSEHMLHAHEVK